METLKRLFAHDRWAIARMLAALEVAPHAQAQALRYLAHLLLAEKIWLLRLQGADTSAVNKSPELSLAECKSLAHELEQAYDALLGSLDEAGLTDELTYKNFAWLEFKTPVRDILMHVALHGTYHRGQVATAMRAAGATPVDTDFITFVRAIGTT
ncbi:MAG TPA: DinB family protein [Pyrinomonadaceae bacterium]|nr:DinB family protein [Pyrinomonadaceae bacterium]